MSTEHRTGQSPGPGQPAARKQPDLSRRSVIRGAAGLAGPAWPLAPSPERLPHQRPRRHGRPGPLARAAGDASRGEPVIVHIRDVKSGEMDVFAGTSHARLTDPGLAARLVRGIS